MRSSCRISPWDMFSVIRAMVRITSLKPVSAAMERPRASRKSPVRTAVGLSHTWWATVRPRRMSAPSTRSSCSRVAACRYSKMVAYRAASGSRKPQSRAHKIMSSGRKRFPPAKRICPATRDTRSKWGLRLSASAVSTAARSPLTSARIFAFRSLIAAFQSGRTPACR